MSIKTILFDRMEGSQGNCPVCGSDCLYYGVVQDCDFGICYPWVCMECGAAGKECYSIDFDSHQGVMAGADARNLLTNRNERNKSNESQIQNKS